MVKKAVILAGGLGTRLSEETELRPKPMVEIGGRPILWHIMKIYSHFGIDEFVVCLGYKGYIIKEYFSNYGLHLSDVTFDFSLHQTTIHRRQVEPWKITLIDTGFETMTGGRLRRVRDYVGDEPFCMTYGDGVADVDIGALIAFHESHGRDATVTAVQPAGRFGALRMSGDEVTGFQEKPGGDGGWINGGFFVLHPRVLDRVADDSTVWEQAPLEGLASDGQLHCFRHEGFWQAMDTLRDKRHLEELWASGSAPWRLW
ncbi:glucose-1-phosphate cytidylyltransferase [uncultured Enterovirga sp.]|uniref:glucose-1-phosphate cytidylyltransferase n=1 Tax=uncultured Enterovirga sp. TaxID=2026352 RepID=UPI0035CC9B51